MVGFGPKSGSGGGGGGSVTINSPAQLPLVAGNYDDFQLTYDLDENLTEIKCYRNAVLLLTVSLEYDIDGNLIRAMEV
jgi:hypothetical protein